VGDEPEQGDLYSRVDYRRVIAWEARIRREGPFLLRLLADAPDDSVLDLGCGTGEHVAFFAQQGARAVGIDRSASMIEAARAHEHAGHGRFLVGEARDAPELLTQEEGFGLALCLGNVLPHVVESAELTALLDAARRVLRPGGLFLVQLLNYERILSQDVRHLPLRFRPGEAGQEVVFLRLLKPGPDGSLLFFPTTLVLDPDAEEPVRVQGSKRVPLRPWTRAELGPAFDAAGFDLRWYGDMAGGGFDARDAPDLVLVARRRPDHGVQGV